jgi:outer membrane protein OmpA-like peptidoglycan-associated protein
MLIKRVSILLVLSMALGAAFAVGQSDVQLRTNRPGANLTVDRGPADGKAVVTVLDARQEPVLGLTTSDFSVSRAGESGRVVSVEPIDRKVDVPRHTVLVVDNSYSLVERKVNDKRLADVEAVAKTIRPIDDVRMVVMRDNKKMNIGGRDLHVEVLNSNKPSELQAFAAKACDPAVVTDNTFLYEEMFAGLALLREMPSDGPRFLWVFSDGEELNSAFKGEVVTEAAQGVGNLRVFAVDYMPTSTIDAFLSTFATQNHGQAKKSGSAADLLAQFQAAASRTEHHYAVTYEFAAPPAVAAAPPPPGRKVMTFQQAALFDFDKAVLKPEGKEQLKKYREEVREAMSRADSVKITGYTDSIGTDAYNKKLSLRRAEAVRDYLVSLGVDRSKLQVYGEGKANPVADNKTAAGRAKNRRVEVEVVGEAK